MDIDFRTIGFVLAGISIGVIAIMLMGSALWPQEAEKYKKLLNNVIMGAVLLLVGSSLLAAFGK